MNSIVSPLATPPGVRSRKVRAYGTCSTYVSTSKPQASRIASKIMMLSQQLARRMKVVYEVDRIAFLFTSGDVDHTHAHVVPMHDKTDITSARYLVQPEPVWSSSHLQTDRAVLLHVKEELAFVPS